MQLFLRCQQTNLYRFTALSRQVHEFESRRERQSKQRAGASPAFCFDLPHEMRALAGGPARESSTNRPSGRFERRRLGEGGPAGARSEATSNLVGSANKINDLQ